MNDFCLFDRHLMSHPIKTRHFSETANGTSLKLWRDTFFPFPHPFPIERLMKSHSTKSILVEREQKISYKNPKRLKEWKKKQSAEMRQNEIRNIAGKLENSPILIVLCKSRVVWTLNSDNLSFSNATLNFYSFHIVMYLYVEKYYHTV